MSSGSEPHTYFCQASDSAENPYLEAFLSVSANNNVFQNFLLEAGFLNSSSSYLHIALTKVLENETEACIFCVLFCVEVAWRSYLLFY